MEWSNNIHEELKIEAGKRTGLDVTAFQRNTFPETFKWECKGEKFSLGFDFTGPPHTARLDVIRHPNNKDAASLNALKQGKGSIHDVDGEQKKLSPQRKFVWQQDSGRWYEGSKEYSNAELALELCNWLGRP